jgi:hypothetical protein
MYDINFLKKRIVPESRKKVITAIVALTALTMGLSLVSIGTFALADLRTTSVYAAEIIDLREHMTSRYPGVPTPEELETIVGKTEPHLKDIGKIVDARIPFTPIWERIAIAVPDGVWLTRVSVTDPRGPQEEMTGKSRSFRGIMIEGVALAGRGPEGDQAVGTFVDNLKNDEEFQTMVTGVEFMGTGLEQVAGTSIIGFEVTCPF